MTVAEPWQEAEIAGPLKASVITKPEVVAAMLKRARRPLLIIGHEVAEADLGNGKAIDYFIRVAKAGAMPVVATAHIFPEFVKRNLKPAAWMPAVDIANRLKDPDWKGFDGKGNYDLLLIAGIPYYMEWVILSGLKHFVSDLKTISLDRFYQPHATWSFANIPVKDWHDNLEMIVKLLGGK